MRGVVVARVRRALAALVLLTAAPAHAQPPTPASPPTSPPASQPVRTATVTTEPRQTFRGWGMALAWEANRFYGSPETAPAIPDRAEQARAMDLLYGDPAHGLTLGLNVARYNIGGGIDPPGSHCDRPPGFHAIPWAEMEGFLPGPGRPYDWSRDASQRRMLDEARRRGATILEAFSNSAPPWMTISGCVEGAAQPGPNNTGADNMRPSAIPAFAAYLAAVARHFDQAGIHFESISPVNEPDGPWWVMGNHQEGSSASWPTQEAIVTALARRLATSGTVVAGTEPNALDKMTEWLDSASPAMLRALGRINVHQYQPSHPAVLQQRAAVLHKPVWASEVGCCFHDEPPIEAALFMANSIRQALTELGAEVWCFWQPDWGVIDITGGHPAPQKQFYAIAQFTRFIRPGFTILATQGDQLVAALSPDRTKLVLVAINPGPETTEDVDLSRLASPGTPVTRFRTTTDTNLQPARLTLGPAAHLNDQEPAASITTYIVPRRLYAPAHG